MKGFWKNNNGCVDARFHSLQTLQFILQRNANARLSGISTAATPSNNSIRKFYCIDRQLAPQHALQFLSTDVSEHEGHSWQPSTLPYAPGQEFQVATDDDYYDEPIYSKPGDRDKL